MTPADEADNANIDLLAGQLKDRTLIARLIAAREGPDPVAAMRSVIVGRVNEVKRGFGDSEV